MSHNSYDNSPPNDRGGKGKGHFGRGLPRSSNPGGLVVTSSKYNRRGGFQRNDSEMRREDNPRDEFPRNSFSGDYQHQRQDKIDLFGNGRSNYRGWNNQRGRGHHRDSNFRRNYNQNDHNNLRNNDNNHQGFDHRNDRHNDSFDDRYSLDEYRQNEDTFVNEDQERNRSFDDDNRHERPFKDRGGYHNSFQRSHQYSDRQQNKRNYNNDYRDRNNHSGSHYSNKEETRERGDRSDYRDEHVHRHNNQRQDGWNRGYGGNWNGRARHNNYSRNRNDNRNNENYKQQRDRENSIDEANRTVPRNERHDDFGFSDDYDNFKTYPSGNTSHDNNYDEYGDTPVNQQPAPENKPFGYNNNYDNGRGSYQNNYRDDYVHQEYRSLDDDRQHSDKRRFGGYQKEQQHGDRRSEPDNSYRNNGYRQRRNNGQIRGRFNWDKNERNLDRPYGDSNRHRDSGDDRYEDSENHHQQNRQHNEDSSRNPYTHDDVRSEYDAPSHFNDTFQEGRDNGGRLEFDGMSRDDFESNEVDNGHHRNSQKWNSNYTGSHDDRKNTGMDMNREQADAGASNRGFRMYSDNPEELRRQHNDDVPGPSNESGQWKKDKNQDFTPHRNSYQRQGGSREHTANNQPKFGSFVKPLSESFEDLGMPYDLYEEEQQEHRRNQPDTTWQKRNNNRAPAKVKSPVHIRDGEPFELHPVTGLSIRKEDLDRADTASDVSIGLSSSWTADEDEENSVRGDIPGNGDIQMAGSEEHSSFLPPLTTPTPISAATVKPSSTDEIATLSNQPSSSQNEDQNRQPKKLMRIQNHVVIAFDCEKSLAESAQKILGKILPKEGVKVANWHVVATVDRLDVVADKVKKITEIVRKYVSDGKVDKSVLVIYVDSQTYRTSPEYLQQFELAEQIRCMRLTSFSMRQLSTNVEARNRTVLMIATKLDGGDPYIFL